MKKILIALATTLAVLFVAPSEAQSSVNCLFGCDCGSGCPTDMYCVPWPDNGCHWNLCGANKSCPSGHTCNQSNKCQRNRNCKTDADCPAELACKNIDGGLGMVCWDRKIPTTCSWPSDCAKFGGTCMPITSYDQSYHCYYPGEEPFNPTLKPTVNSFLE